MNKSHLVRSRIGSCAVFLLLLTGITTFAQISNTLPYVLISVVDNSGAETGADPATLKISRNSTAGALEVSYALSGTASNGVDFVHLPGSIVIPNGASNVLLQVTPIDDAIAEPLESVIFTLRTNQNYLVEGASNTAKPTVYIKDNDNVLPTVHMISPTNQSVFQAPTHVVLKAEANDSDGWLRRVEFLKNGSLIGSVAGQDSNNVYTLVWSNAPVGTFSMTARAIDNFEAARTSAPVTITVLASTNPPVISVSATDAIAAESGQTATNTGTFKISRTGSTNSALTVLFSLSGTASNQVDYLGIGDSVNIPAGASFANVLVKPIDDNLVEQTETVVLSLRSNLNYTLGEVRTATVSIQDNDPTNAPPTVRILQPTNHAAFTLPTNVVIAAEALDANGVITKVSFFANGTLLGVVSNYNTTPGILTNVYHFTWTNPPAGEHVLTAKATDNANATKTSEPINIVVRHAEIPRPIVTITASDPEAAETGPLATAVANTAMFLIQRKENTNVALTVYYSIGGTAQNGVDYDRITNEVFIPSGQTSVKVWVRPIDDNLVESNETVVLELEEPVCIAIFPPPPECYIVGTPRTATAVIRDNDQITNAPPVVHLTAPTNGAVFHGPLDITVAAHATDADGSVVRVDFFSGDRWLGADTDAPYSVLWTNVAPGIYNVAAKATDNLGATRFSEPSRITVKSAIEQSFVFRRLPIWYVPGVKLTVHLRCEPGTNTLSYSVSDRPPTNWIIHASEGGTLSNDGAITFGPFSNNVARTLTYQVTPPVGEHGEKRFIGSATADGLTSPVGGTQVIVHAPPHPADRSGTNFIMTLSEVTQYSTAWRRSERWPISPNPIPVNYVSRAGFLYKRGGEYTLSTASPTPVPPLLWVSTNGPLAVAQYSDEAAWSTNRFGFAVSAMPTNYSAGVPFTVTIDVTPANGVAAYAVEDRVPEGWTVTNITHEGIFCPVTSRVRWGVFLNSTNRTLSYQVTPRLINAPATAAFAGVASFDGVNVPITGQRKTYRATTIGPARLESVKRLDDGNRLLTFVGEPGVTYQLEGTSNFVEWAPLEVLLNNDGVLQFIDVAGNAEQRFYRAVPQE